MQTSVYVKLGFYSPCLQELLPQLSMSNELSRLEPFDPVEKEKHKRYFAIGRKGDDQGEREKDR